MNIDVNFPLRSEQDKNVPSHHSSLMPYWKLAKPVRQEKEIKL